MVAVPGANDAFELRVTCPSCKREMRPSRWPEHPHAFICPGCEGEVDAQVRFGSIGERTCGGVRWDKGVRCGERIPAVRTVCDNCAYAAALEWVKTAQGRKILAALLNDDEIETARGIARRRREAEAEERRRKAEQDGNQPAHVVYYARLGDNHIKIGTTKDLPRRMVELRVVNVSNLLAAEPGGYDLEHERHDQFKKWRYNRRKEDFGEGPDLLAHIENVRAIHGNPYELAESLLAKTIDSTLKSA